MFLSAVSVLVVAQSSSAIREGLMNNPVYILRKNLEGFHTFEQTDYSPQHWIIFPYIIDSGILETETAGCVTHRKQ